MASFGAQSCLHSVWGFFCCYRFVVLLYRSYFAYTLNYVLHVCVQGHLVFSMVAFMWIFEPSSKVLADFLFVSLDLWISNNCKFQIN